MHPIDGVRHTETADSVACFWPRPRPPPQPPHRSIAASAQEPVAGLFHSSLAATPFRRSPAQTAPRHSRSGAARTAGEAQPARHRSLARFACSQTQFFDLCHETNERARKNKKGGRIKFSMFIYVTCGTMVLLSGTRVIDAYIQRPSFDRLTIPTTHNIS